jgi:hypothetical protein
MPLAFIRNVNVDAAGGVTTVTYQQREMDRVGKSTPIADDRLAVTTTYTLEANRIVRRDVFTPRVPLDVTSIQLEYAGFSTGPRQEGATTRFDAGAVTSFTVDGLETCESRALDHDHDYESDTGPMTALVVCSTGMTRFDRPRTIAWTMTLR